MTAWTRQYEITAEVLADSPNIAIAHASRIIAYGDHSDTFFQVEIVDVTVTPRNDSDGKYSVVFMIQDRFSDDSWNRFECELIEHSNMVTDVTQKEK